MKSFSFLLTIVVSLLFGIQSLAAPIVERSQCPSPQEMARWLEENTCIGDNTIFYTTPANERDAEQFSNQVGGTYYGVLIDQRMKKVNGATEDGIFWKWVDACGGTPEEENKVAHHVSQALAMKATGPTYLMLPKGATPKPSSFWLVDEWPMLKKRGIKVTQVQPQTFDQTPYNGP